MCRSATIQRPVGERVGRSPALPAARRQAAVELRELPRRRRRTSVRLGLGARLARPRARAAPRPRRAARRPRAASSGCARRPGGRAIAQPAAAASSATRAQAVDAGHEDRRAVEELRARAAPSRASARWTRPASVARDRRAADQRPRPQQDDAASPGSSRSACSTPRATIRSFGRSSTTIVCSFAPRARTASCRRPARRSGSRRGSAPPPPRAPSSESAISASSRASSFSRCERAGG